MTATLTLEPLSVYHGAQCLLQDVSLTLTAGRVHALVGRSGAGKSMTAAAFAVRPWLPGLVCRGGRLVGSKGIPRLAHVVQNPRTAFNPLMTLRAHGLETLAARGRRGREAQQALTAAIEEVGLAPSVASLYAFELSGGMLQRMMLAMALLQGADFLIADEPTSDLDSRSQQRILELIDGLVHRHGLGLLLVTHDMGIVARYADTVQVIDGGRIVEATTPAALFQSPESAAARALLSAHRALYGNEMTSTRKGMP